MVFIVDYINIKTYVTNKSIIFLTNIGHKNNLKNHLFNISFICLLNA